MKTTDHYFPERFRENLAALGLARPGLHLLVGLSGGRDSVVLLHLLRFVTLPHPLRLTAAHLDHAMRPDSAAAARWVRGLCRAWEVPLVSERALAPLRTEDEARTARYRFLRQAARQAGATHIATAHHADDQAETVLFRVLRGTGIAGLAGIPPTTRSGLVRPLLPFWRAEVARYARAHRLRWREDPTNLALHATRNRIRHDILPRLERSVAPGARRSLVRLAEIAHEEEAAWQAVLAPLLADLVREEEGALVLARRRLGEYHGAIATRILRSALRQFGIVLDRAGTRTALQFITEAPSGRELRLPGGFRIRNEFDTARAELIREIAPDRTLEFPRPEPGAECAGTVRVGGREYRVRLRETEQAPLPSTGEAPWWTALRPAALHFPLRLRGWRAGDRIRLGGGTKTLKKLFGERKVPLSQRERLPLLTDSRGAVLWIPGVAHAHGLTARPGERQLLLEISEE